MVEGKYKDNKRDSNKIDPKEYYNRYPKKILEEWRKLEGKSCIGEISEEYILAFEKEVFLRKRNKKIHFILGEPLPKKYWLY